MIYFLVLRPAFESANVDALLSNFLFVLLVIDTMLIAGIANVVNDIFDEHSDQANDKTKDGYQRDKAISWLIVLIINAISISLFVAYQIENLKLSVLSIGAIILLIFYSSHLQKTILIGNIVVSLFVSFVTGIVWFAEREAYQNLANQNEALFKEITLLLASYMVFSFVANMYREIIKDIEDVKGDAAAGYRTMPVVWGVQSAKIIALFYGVFLCMLSCLWSFINPLNDAIVEKIFFLGFITLPSFYALYQSYKARNISEFHWNSQIIKLIMAMGLIYLILIRL